MLTKMFLLVVMIIIVCGKFHIERSGNFPVGIEDVGVRFYLSIANNMKNQIVISKSRQPECCWKVQEGDIDCKSMQLFGGFQTTIDRASIKNMTFVFPNIYPLDRVGSCKFFLKELKDTQSMIHELKFDTTYKEDSTFMQSLFSGGPEVYKRCKGVDQNIRNNCKPYKCSKKYNGHRSFYNEKTGKCEPVYRCSTRLGDDDLPTTAFDYENNRCKTLVPELTEKEKQVAKELLENSPLAKEANQYVDINAEELVIDCKHGYQEGSHCRCYHGWVTVSVKTKNGGLKMNWCSKKVPVKSNKSNKYAKWTVFGILTTVCVSLVVLLLYLWWKLFIQQIINNKKEQPSIEGKKLNEHEGGVQLKRGRSKSRSPSDNSNKRNLSEDNRQRSKSPRSSSRNRKLDFSDDED